MYNITGNEKLEILGIKLFPTNKKYDFYIFYIDGERTAYVDKRLIIFKDINNAGKALECSTCGASVLKLPDPIEVSEEYDFLQTIRSLSSENILKIIEPEMKTHPNTMELDCMQLLVDYFYDIESEDERLNDPLFDYIQGTATDLYESNDISYYTQDYRNKVIESIYILIGKIAHSAFYVD